MPASELVFAHYQMSRALPFADNRDSQPARFPAYDAKFFNVKMPEGTKMQVQDRAYTSPIWYTP